MRSISSISIATFKGFVRDRILYGVLLFAVLFLGFSYTLSMLTIIEERKILLDFGLSAISISGMILGIFLGVVSIAKEIENRTIYTIISKPLSRTEYVIGKYLGALAILAIVHVLLSTTLVGVTKLLDEGLPSGLPDCFLLLFCESAILLAIASFFSVFTNSFLAGTFSFTIFLVGRSNTALNALAQKSQSHVLSGIFKFVYWASPNLERFNIRDLVAYGKPYPHEMISRGLIYCILYICFSISLASWTLSRKDLP